ncbi:MAG: riboflavin synthase subunit alpha [Kiloniella sp.]|nr:riboflavin synthase subunit alpha [Kiloniella sp.]
MFTGIITDVGTVVHREDRGDTLFRVETAYRAENIEIGASICCNGACMTVIATEQRDPVRATFDFEASAESLSKTTMAGWLPGQRLNLERSLALGDELGGHLVSGHVDAVAEVVERVTEGDSWRLTIRPPADLMPFFAPKGSVALDGVSLTVNEVGEDSFGINMISHTQAVTAFSELVNRPISGTSPALINLEIDQLARYVHRQLQFITSG